MQRKHEEEVAKRFDLKKDVKQEVRGKSEKVPQQSSDR
jgi:hypothetical protein